MSANDVSNQNADQQKPLRGKYRETKTSHYHGWVYEGNDDFDVHGANARYSWTHCGSCGGIALPILIFVILTYVRKSTYETDEIWEQPPNGKFECDTSIVVSNYDPDVNCPEECPFWQEDLATKYELCDFKCVEPTSCGMLHQGQTVADVPDKKAKICRSCLVPSCSKCVGDGNDHCKECDWDCHLTSDGKCVSRFQWMWYIVLAVVAIALAFIIAWYIHLWMRPVVNEEGLAEGLLARSRAKLHTPKNSSMGIPSGHGHRKLWPMTVNLLKVPLAGPGLQLHMHFQVAVLLWASLLLIGWLVLAHSTDPDILHTGTQESRQTPVQQCRSIVWAHQVREKNRVAKIVFLALAYVMSFALALLHAVLQRRRFQIAGNKCVTMSDYTAFLKGVPKLSGATPVETNVQAALKAATGQEVVGVSICWDFASQQAEVKRAIDWVLEAAAENRETSTPTEASGTSCSAFRWVDSWFLPPKDYGNQDTLDSEDINKLVCNLTTGHCGFVVFRSEQARDDAVESCQRNGGVPFEGGELSLEIAVNEPDTVNWEFMLNGRRTHIFRLCCAVPMMFVALALWTCCFYLPYAKWQTSFSYGINDEPGFLADTIFSLVITTGNLVMLCVCDWIAKRIGFGIQDVREAVHMCLYTAAILLNSFLDLYCIYKIAWKNQANLGAHSVARNKLLKDIPQFPDGFQTYALQKEIGGRMLAMCFPSCFLLPFIMEQIFFVMLPAHISMLVVGSYDHVKGSRAEWALSMFACMDMGRYADLILNVALAVCIFLFPTGFWATTFVYLICSHVYIYAYDTWKVLRCVPTFVYGGNYIDRCAHYVIIVPCGMLAMVWVFSLVNCHPQYPCLRGWALTGLCWAVFFIHVAIHVVLLHWVVPWISQMQHEKERVPYSVAASATPSTFFSTNPVHCLRSNHFYNHRPPCIPYVPGKEHLLNANPDIGIHFEDDDVEVERYMVRHRDQVETFAGTFCAASTEARAFTKATVFHGTESEVELSAFAGKTNDDGLEHDGPPAFSQNDS